MSIYIRFEDVRLRVLGKIKFTDDPDEENKMPIQLARRLIDEAESDVEQDLSRRYAVPFQTVDGQPYQMLPQRPTRDYIRTLCEMKAVIRLLETDFGESSASDSSKYTEKLEKRYTAMKDKQLEEREYGGEKQPGQWLYPPLPAIMLAFQNNQADDGYMGQVMHTSEGVGDFPSAQINDPSSNFWNGTIDDLDKEGPVP